MIYLYTYFKSSVCVQIYLLGTQYLVLPLNHFGSVRTDTTEAPALAYVVIWVAMSRSVAMSPLEGEARLNSAAKEICGLPIEPCWMMVWRLSGGDWRVSNSVMRDWRVWSVVLVLARATSWRLWVAILSRMDIGSSDVVFGVLVYVIWIFYIFFLI